jgi:hypothetical protein
MNERGYLLVSVQQDSMVISYGMIMVLTFTRLIFYEREETIFGLKGSTALSAHEHIIRRERRIRRIHLNSIN